MAIYEYTPGDPGKMRLDTVGLVGKRRDVDIERHTLINMGMNAVARGEAHTKEVAHQLARADVRRLPLELMSRLLDPDYYDAPVMNRANGLAMYAPREEGRPYFALLSEEVKDAEDLIAEERMDRDTLDHLTVRGAITHDALQLEPYMGQDETLMARAHSSFGYMVEGIGYVPVVTVLSTDHPVRQLIDARRQEA
ncbi:MAG TPA: hypothetical protein VFX84_02020 [Candidatus Saccharimonadales bacterium]|nr:hypothetical protein [Candidatus Saccharimonadales bacterium]